MLFSTPTQFAVLGLVLIAGWLFGLASHPGGRKWRERYVGEREAHAATRSDVEARLSQANARIVELERENARLAAATPVPAVRARPATRTSAVPAYPASERRGWFEWNNLAH